MMSQNDDEDKECKFDLLNDKCCNEILRRMPLVDLCALSRTCVRFYNLCNKEFQLVHSSKVMYIDDVNDNGELVIGPSQEKYVDTFNKKIQNVVLRGDALASKLDVVNAYYNQDESIDDRPLTIKHIILLEWMKEQFVDAGRTFADLLRNVETITLDYVWIDTDWYETFLRYTPNIKHLKVLYRCVFEQRQNWLENVYPQLETLECYAVNYKNEILPQKLNIFRRLNPKVRHVSLYAEKHERITDWIKNDVKVDELFFSVNNASCIYDIDTLKVNLSAVAELIKTQNTKVHLLIGGRGESVSEDALIAEISSLKSNIVGIYLPWAEIGEKLAITISSFENVRVLMMDKSKHNKIIAQMPQLEEMYFGSRWEDFEDWFDTMYDTMRTLVGGAAKLKKMYIHSWGIAFTRFEFANLDRERMKLKSACKLKIYISSEDDDGTDKLDDADRIFNCIEIIRTSTEPTNNPHFARVRYNMCCKFHFSDYHTGKYLDFSFC